MLALPKKRSAGRAFFRSLPMALSIKNRACPSGPAGLQRVLGGSGLFLGVTRPLRLAVERQQCLAVPHQAGLCLLALRDPLRAVVIDSPPQRLRRRHRVTVLLQHQCGVLPHSPVQRLSQFLVQPSAAAGRVRIPPGISPGVYWSLYEIRRLREVGGGTPRTKRGVHP